MKVLITGGYGYIGKHVVKECLRRGLETFIVDRKDREKISNVTLFKYDVLTGTVQPDLYTILNRPDIIIHLAWQDGFNHTADSHMLNLPKHYMFLKNMVDSGVKSLVVLGSMHEVGYYEGEVNEDTPCNPSSLYGISKNALRQAVLTYAYKRNTSVKWLRAYYITGDDKNNHSVFSKILELVEKHEKTFPFTTGKNKYDFLDINELAKQIVDAAIQNEVSGIINVCSGHPMSLKDKVEEFIKRNNLNIKPDFGKYPDRKYDSPCIYGNATLIKKIQDKVK